ncbi:hypothetical protein E2320_005663 [Naja naja]|nr:hypothetical protein E2320_005663 [Naja naja]
MLRAAGLAGLLLLLAALGGFGGLCGAPGETFTSMLSIRRALGTEQALLGHLRSYLEDEASRLRDLDSGTMANPLMAFALIKRLQSDWRNVVYSLEGSENIQGAARALMRLQDIYTLSVKELARGRFRMTSGAHPDLYRPRQDFVLSADDCFHIGKVAYDKEDYYHSIPWMEEAVQLFRISYGKWNTEDEWCLEEALDHLAFSYFMDQEEGKGKITLQRPNVTHLETRDAYEELCQRLGSQPAHRRLSCSYETNRSPWLILQPLKKEILHPRPELAFLDPVVGALGRRAAAITGLNIQHPYAEYLQVVNYGLGGHYEPHFDHATSRKSPLYRMKSGNRIATLMVYPPRSSCLGWGPFPSGPPFLPPPLLVSSKNAALFWWNLRKNGQGDEATLHAGCPVLAGDKWVANKWFHEHGQEFHRRCSTHPEE